MYTAELIQSLYIRRSELAHLPFAARQVALPELAQIASLIRYVKGGN